MIGYFDSNDDTERVSKRLFRLSSKRHLNGNLSQAKRAVSQNDTSAINRPPQALLKQVKKSQNLAQIAQNIKDMSRRMKLNYNGRFMNGNDDSSWVKDV